MSYIQLDPSIGELARAINRLCDLIEARWPEGFPQLNQYGELKVDVATKSAEGQY